MARCKEARFGPYHDGEALPSHVLPGAPSSCFQLSWILTHPTLGRHVCTRYAFRAPKASIYSGLHTNRVINRKRVDVWRLAFPLPKVKKSCVSGRTAAPRNSKILRFTFCAFAPSPAFLFVSLPSCHAQTDVDFAAWCLKLENTLVLGSPPPPLPMWLANCRFSCRFLT